jgi:hypothetical protein
MTEWHEHSSRRLLVTAALVTAAFGLALAARVPIGIPGEWVWRPNELPVELWWAALSGLVLVAVTWLVTRPGWWAHLRPMGRAGALAFLILAVFALQCSLLNAVGAPWAAPGAVIASPVATTYYSVSLDIRDPSAWIASYPERMSSLPYHVRTHPPGFVLFFLLLRGACARLLPHPSRWLGEVAEAYRTFGIGLSPADAAAAIAGAFIISLIGALSLWPCYLLGRRLMGAEAALCSAALMAAMPGLLVFGASADEMVLTFTVITLWLSYSAWRQSSPVRAFLAGLTLAVGLFCTLGMLTVAAWLVIWLVVGMARSSDRAGAARRAVLGALAGGAGLAVFYLALYFTVGYRPLAVAREALLAHRGVTTVEAARTYWKWLLMNPAEMVVFAGLPLVIAALWSCRGTGQEPGLGRWRSFLLSWLITCALLDVSGTVRGEVGRIWLFLLWPTALAAGPWLAARPRRATVIALLVALTAWQAILMRGYLTIYDIF